MAKPPDPSSIFGPPTPKKQAGPPSANTTLAAIYKLHPGLRQYNGVIAEAARRWGVTSVDVALILSIEDGSGDRNARNPKSGALGLAQILDTNVDRSLNPTQYATFVSQFGGDLTDQRKTNPTFAINYLAWRMSYGIRAYGSLDAWYSGSGGNGRPRGYNPGYVGPAPSSILGQAKVPGYQDILPPSPTDTAGRSADTSQAAQGFKPIKDPWVVVDKSGAITLVRTPNPPANAVKANGQPVPYSVFKAFWTQNINPVYMSYTGKNATAAQAKYVIQSGISLKYTLPNALVKSPRFVNSPMWKHAAPAYTAIWQSIYGPNSKPPSALIGKAIANSWDSTAFQQVARQQPTYTTSNEFHQNMATMTAAYRTVFGTPDLAGASLIKEATAAGWSPDQFANYLRQRPDYTSSVEYRNNILDLYSQLGLITGAVPDLVPGSTAPLPGQQQGSPQALKTLAGAQGAAYGQGVYPAAPNSPLVPGKPKGPLAPNNLTVGAVNA